MKRNRLFMMAAFVVVCASVSAQQVITLDELQQRKKTQAKTTQTKAVQPKAQKAKVGKSVLASTGMGFSTFYLQYNAASQKYSHDGHSISTSLPSFSAGYTKAFPLGPSLYIEPGVALQYLFKSEKEDGRTEKFSMLSAKIPVNVIYSLPVGDGIYIDPYAGVYLRGNILAQYKYEHGGHSETVDLFSKDDMGSSDNTAKRMQVGMNLGVRARFSKFLVGLGYSMDLTDFTKNEKTNSFDITLGMTF